MTNTDVSLFGFEGIKPSLVFGSVVKRLRHRPFTAVTRVRFSSESLGYIIVEKCCEWLLGLRVSKQKRVPYLQSEKNQIARLENTSARKTSAERCEIFFVAT